VVETEYGFTFWNHVFFSSYLDGLVQRYPEIFEGSGNSSQYQANFGKKWKAYSTVYELADGNISRLDEVVQEPLEKCLLFLSYRADKILLEDLVHREMMKKTN
jgi:hypothetical protein